MPKFRVCVVEHREYIVEVEATDVSDAEEQAKFEYEDNSVSDAFREVIVDWVKEEKDDTDD